MTWAVSPAVFSSRRLRAEICKSTGPKETSLSAAAWSMPPAVCRTITRGCSWKGEMHKRTSPEIRSTEILAWRAGALAKRQSDFVAHEELLEIRVCGRSVAGRKRSPGHDEELAAGFVLMEGLLRRPGD